MPVSKFEEGGRVTRVCTADRHTLCVGHEGALHNSNTNELAFRKNGKFWDFPGRGKVGTGTAAASLLPIRLCALKRSAYRTNTAVVLASPQLLIPPTTARTACVRADPRSHRRPFPVPHRVALPRSFPLSEADFGQALTWTMGKRRYTTRNPSVPHPARRDFSVASPPERRL